MLRALFSDSWRSLSSFSASCRNFTEVSSDALVFAFCAANLVKAVDAVEEARLPERADRDVVHFGG